MTAIFRLESDSARFSGLATTGRLEELTKLGWRLPLKAGHGQQASTGNADMTC
jgi:hypothetical protein